MEWSGFVFVVVLVTAGHAAALQERECDNPNVCLVDKTEEYLNLRKNMTDSITRNKHLIEAQEWDKFENVDEKISGDEDNCMEVTTVFRYERGLAPTIQESAHCFRRMSHWIGYFYDCC